MLGQTMAMDPPQPISAAELRARLRRVMWIARRLGFKGQVEYRHVLSTVGGAQYGLGVSQARDLLVVYADAFRRDSDPDDFSLEAIIAHERGHQLVNRHSRLRRLLSRRRHASVSEEILASLIGSLIAESEADRESLVLKAVADAIQCGVEARDSARTVAQLRSYLEKLL